MKRSAINPVSKRRAVKLRERKTLIAAMEENGPVLCQFWSHFGDGRDPVHRADDLHEILSRARGGSITDPANTIPLCREHQIWTTEHPLEATAMGLVAAPEARDGAEGG